MYRFYSEQYLKYLSFVSRTLLFLFRVLLISEESRIYAVQRETVPVWKEKHAFPNQVTFRGRCSVAEGLIVQILLIMSLVFNNNNIFGEIVVGEAVSLAAPVLLQIF